MAKLPDCDRLRTFFSGDNFKQRIDRIVSTGQPLIIRKADNTPYDLTTEQATAILHEYTTALDAAVTGPTIVIFHPRPTFYVYAGYYELYISTDRLPEPYVEMATFKTIDAALQFADDQDEHINYCESVRDHLPAHLYEYLQENGYEYVTFKNDHD